MCGLPCSGKTSKVDKLKKFIEETSERKVHIVNDHNFVLDKNDVYSGNLFI